MSNGTFTISFDTELIWGRIHLDNYDEFIQRAEKVHIILPKLLKILDTYKVPVTWAVVGHILLESCPPDGHKHPEIIRPHYKNQKADWFANDPGTNEKRDPAWYGKTLLTKIQKYPYHDIGCHTFSHFYWGEKGCSKSAAESDVKLWSKVAKQNKIHASSFVFPKNSIRYLDLLSKYGFTTYRDTDDVWYKKLPSITQTFAQIIDLFLPPLSSTTTPYKNRKLIAIPGSFYFPSGRGIRRYIPKHVRAQKAIAGIDKAIMTGTLFHVWTHPIDFSEDTEKLLHDFEHIVAYAAHKRDEGVLNIAHMKTVSETLL